MCRLLELFYNLWVDRRTGNKTKQNYEINKYLLLRSKSKKSKNYGNVNYYLVTTSLEFNLELFYSVKTISPVPLMINCYYLHIIRVPIATKNLYPNLYSSGLQSLW